MATKSRTKKKAVNKIKKGERIVKPTKIGHYIVERENWDFQQRIIVHSKFQVMKDLTTILETEQQLELFNQGPFSKFQHFRGDVYPKKLTHVLVLSQVESGKKDELHFKIGGKILVFNMYDFELISGLNCNPVPRIHDVLRSDNPLKDEYFKVRGTQRAQFLLGLLSGKFGGTDEEKVALVNIAILETMILPMERLASIPDDHLKMAIDTELFARYPWGRVSFNALCESLKKLKYYAADKTGFNIEGFLHPLIAWTYEVMPDFEALGFTSQNTTCSILRMLKWSFSYSPEYDEVLSIFDNEIEINDVNATEDELAEGFILRKHNPDPEPIPYPIPNPIDKGKDKAGSSIDQDDYEPSEKLDELIMKLEYTDQQVEALQKSVAETNEKYDNLMDLFQVYIRKDYDKATPKPPEKVKGCVSSKISPYVQEMPPSASIRTEMGIPKFGTGNNNEDHNDDVIECQISENEQVLLVEKKTNLFKKVVSSSQQTLTNMKFLNNASKYAPPTIEINTESASQTGLEVSPISVAKEYKLNDISPFLEIEKASHLSPEQFKKLQDDWEFAVTDGVNRDPNKYEFEQLPKVHATAKTYKRLRKNGQKVPIPSAVDTQPEPVNVLTPILPVVEINVAKPDIGYNRKSKRLKKIAENVPNQQTLNARPKRACRKSVFTKTPYTTEKKARKTRNAEPVVVPDAELAEEEDVDPDAEPAAVSENEDEPSSQPSFSLGI